MAWRIALASIDDVLVTEHFGRSKWFYIRDVEADGTSRSLGRRDVQPLCSNCEDSNPGEFSVEPFLDCTAVLTAKIGPGPQKKLEAAGISVFEGPAVIDEAVKKLAAYYVRTRHPQNA
ncbi:MAG: dinitrogenase iron-molybdenum cofactor biosynthesis protein [Spirochaetaceae bacterium]|jgi:nitrogen fixation protein NifB|nr:dinitrogenase iron-molybdenum cofactor biosynthesis protein [Spirochaetaceae bacterium]